MPHETPLLKRQAHKLRRSLRKIGDVWSQVEVYWRPVPRGFWLRGAPPPYSATGRPEWHLGLTYPEARRNVRAILRNELGPERRERFRRFAAGALKVAKAVLPYLLKMIPKRGGGTDEGRRDG